MRGGSLAWMKKAKVRDDNQRSRTMRLRAPFQWSKPEALVIVAVGAIVAVVLVYFVFALLFKYFD